jgi:hypothetical protein
MILGPNCADPDANDLRAVINLAAIVADLQEKQAEHAHLVVNLPPKHIKDA